MYCARLDRNFDPYANARRFADVIAHLCQSFGRCVGHVRLLLAEFGFSANKH
jgi:hypothetical protein